MSFSACITLESRCTRRIAMGQKCGLGGANFQWLIYVCPRKTCMKVLFITSLRSLCDSLQEGMSLRNMSLVIPESSSIMALHSHCQISTTPPRSAQTCCFPYPPQKVTGGYSCWLSSLCPYVPPCPHASMLGSSLAQLYAVALSSMSPYFRWCLRREKLES